MENGKLKANCKLAEVPSGIANAAQPHALNITPSRGCSPNFNQTTALTSYTLRATDYVLLEAGTTINPTITGYFAIQTLPCPDADY